MAVLSVMGSEVMARILGLKKKKWLKVHQNKNQEIPKEQEIKSNETLDTESNHTGKERCTSE